ncbi:hypothetical protein ACG7TL_002331 [Trametes sanguinea]
MYYGPVLSQTDLYLLGAELELNPILKNESGSFQLIFNISTESRDRDIPFTQKDEPATLPRVEELIIITDCSPWCTIVKNPQGVTLGDIVTTLFKEYSEKMVTDKEFESLPPRQQEQLRRYAASASTAGNWGQFYSPAPAPPTSYRRAASLYRIPTSYHFLKNSISLEAAQGRVDLRRRRIDPAHLPRGAVQSAMLKPFPPVSIARTWRVTLLAVKAQHVPHWSEFQPVMEGAPPMFGNVGREPKVVKPARGGQHTVAQAGSRRMSLTFRDHAIVTVGASDGVLDAQSAAGTATSAVTSEANFMADDDVG